MNTFEITEKLKDVIKPYLPQDVELESIEVNQNFTKDIGISSVHLVDIVLDIEDAFDIEIQNEELEKIHNLQDAIELVQRKRLPHE